MGWPDDKQKEHFCFLIFVDLCLPLSLGCQSGNPRSLAREPFWPHTLPIFCLPHSLRGTLQRSLGDNNQSFHAWHTELCSSHPRGMCCPLCIPCTPRKLPEDRGNGGHTAFRSLQHPVHHLSPAGSLETLVEWMEVEQQYLDTELCGHTGGTYLS